MNMRLDYNETYIVTVYVGLRRGYNGEIMPFEEVEKFIQDWADITKICVTVTRTKFIYTGGNEPGIIVGFINYPRFPSTPSEIDSKAFQLAKELMYYCHQMGVTIVTPKLTTTWKNPEEIKKYRPEDAN